MIAVVSSPMPRYPEAVGDNLVSLLCTGSLDAPQHRDVAVREDLAKPHPIHFAGDPHAPALRVRPQLRLLPRQRGRIGQQGRGGVESHAVFTHGHQSDIVAREQPQDVVRHAPARPSKTIEID
jgi:hypothetical protein